MTNAINIQEKFLLNVSEAAEILRIQPNTIRVWLCKNTVLPKSMLIKLGRRVFFSKVKLLEWVQNGCPAKELSEGGEDNV